MLNNLFDGSNMVEKFEGRVILDEGEYSSTKLQENMQTKLVLAQSMPPELVNWAWILKDSDLPDINEQIEYINMMMGIQQGSDRNADRYAGRSGHHPAAISRETIKRRASSNPLRLRGRSEY